MLTPLEHKRLEKYIHDIDVAQLSSTFDALGEPNRCLIFRALIKGSLVRVSDLARVVGISDALASQHLKILFNADLVCKQKDGKNVFYKINNSNRLAVSLKKAVEA